MAQSLKLALVASITGSYGGPNDVAAPAQTFNVAQRLALAFGTAASQADQVFSDTRTIAASGSENLDLAGGLTDAFGATLTMVEVVAIFIYAHPANTNDVVVGGAASNTFVGPFGDATDKIAVKPGGLFLIAAPTNPAYAVTAGTGDLLKVANSGSGSSVDYDIIVVARSA